MGGSFLIGLTHWVIRPVLDVLLSSVHSMNFDEQAPRLAIRNILNATHQITIICDFLVSFR